jgi:site-specific DNA-methyltransferase (adenine-specific)
MNDSPRAPRNRTVTLSPAEIRKYRKRLRTLTASAPLSSLLNTTIHQTMENVVPFLPRECVDLLFLDPPYNLNKAFRSSLFKEMTPEAYAIWFGEWFSTLLPLLKPTASVYICGDWRSSSAIQHIAGRSLIVRNRITWEREKGRGARANWKNASEDIWFCTVSDNYTFHLDAVKVQRKVLAPYKDEKGLPKDWKQTDQGGIRLTHPSNLWTDLTVPFWSMPENTDHPTQKPEKLLAKILLASSNPEDIILDPFLGSGTTSVVAKKLGRNFIGIEADEHYALLAEKRIALAEHETGIQGFQDGIFYERNTHRSSR